MSENASDDEKNLRLMSEEVLTLLEGLKNSQVKVTSLRKTLIQHNSILTQLDISIEKQNNVIKERNNVAKKQNYTLADLDRKLHNYDFVLMKQNTEIERQSSIMMAQKALMKWLDTRVISLKEKRKTYGELSSVNDALIEIRKKKYFTVEEIVDENNCPKQIIYFKEKTFAEYENIENNITTLANQAADLAEELQIVEYDMFGPTLSSTE